VADGLAARDPSWSPDGGRLVFTVGSNVAGDPAAPAKLQPWELRVVDAAGRRQRRLTYHCAWPTPGGRALTGTHLDDRIHARDGRAERISCGRGRDLVVADARDRVAADCERVVRR
jgi:hypothetical protein